jgi:hypothetical protein
MSKRISRFSPYSDKGKTTRDFENWSKSEMTKELFNVGIKVPTDFSRKRLSDTGFPMFLTHDICV